MRRVALVLLSFSLATVAVAQQPAPPPQPKTGGFAFPPKFGVAELVGVEDFEAKEPGLGQLGRYKFQGWSFGAYVYDKRRRDIAEQPNAAQAKAELDLAVADILEAKKLGHYARVEEGTAFAIPPTFNPPTFFCRAFVLQQVPKAGSTVPPPYDSYLCVATVKQKFVKLRISSTTPSGDQATVFTPVAASIELFGRQLLR